MQTLTLYAVRVRGTQKYLPRSQRRDERGGSWLEPIDFTDPSTWPEPYVGYQFNMMIRTYANRRGAENLMRSWVQGRFRHDGECGGYQQDRDRGPEMGRQIEDLEVVELILELPPI